MTDDDRRNEPGKLYLGLISGTSADGIDAAVLRFEPDCRVLTAHTFVYPVALREELLRVAQDPQGLLSLDALGPLDAQVGACFAEAALTLLHDAGIAPSSIHAIGSHGQTIRHRPSGNWPFTLQLGDPSRIVERTGITTVADFRRRDIAAGGQGAPLACAFHAAMFARAHEARAVLNIGGIANLTLLQNGQPVNGFDCGPGNALMDAWMLRHFDQAFDANGERASQGQIDSRLLQKLLTDPYFKLPPPKSTGREQFHLAWLDQQLSEHPTIEAIDVLATLLEFTAVSIVDALHRWQPECARVLICGGGVRNATLMRRIATLLPKARVESTAAHGIDPDFVEAATFAWLARETLAGRPGNLPSVSGASGLRILGAIYPR